MKMRIFAVSCLLIVLFSGFTLNPVGEHSNGLYATIITSKGTIVVQLEYELVPMTVGNFVGLVEGTIENKHKQLGEPFYDGLTFHRVIPDGIIQGGCPEGNGMGNPGYKFKDEFSMKLVHDKPGILSMANSGKHTNGSQFFITHRAIESLDHKHTVFGHVVEGMDVVNSITEGDMIKTISIMYVGSKASDFKSADHFTEKDRKKAD